MANSVDTTLKNLLQRIVMGYYDTVLPPQDILATELGVSRTAYREAVAKLEFCNVLVSKPKLGTVVRPQKEWAAGHPYIARWLFMSDEKAIHLNSAVELLHLTGGFIANSRPIPARPPMLDMSYKSMIAVHLYVFERLTNNTFYRQFAPIAEVLFEALEPHLPQEQFDKLMQLTRELSAKIIESRYDGEGVRKIYTGIALILHLAVDAAAANSHPSEIAHA